MSIFSNPLAGMLVNQIGGTTTNVINQNLNLLSGKIINALGPTFGSAFTTFLSNSWYAQGIRRADPHLSIDWDVTLPVLQASGNPALSGLPSATLPTSYVEAVNAPLWGYEEGGYGGIYRGGSYIHIPGILTVGNLSMNFYEDVNFTSTKYLNYWRNLIAYNGKYGYTKDYKHDIKVRIMDANQTVHYEITYHGCWPYASVGNYDLIGDGTHRTVVNEEFYVDYVSISSPSAARSLGNALGLNQITGFVSGLGGNVVGSLASGGTSILSGALNTLHF